MYVCMYVCKCEYMYVYRDDDFKDWHYRGVAYCFMLEMSGNDVVGERRGVVGEGVTRGVEEGGLNDRGRWGLPLSWKLRVGPI